MESQVAVDQRVLTLFLSISQSEHGWVTSAELTLNKWGSLNQSKQNKNKYYNTYQLLILTNRNPRFWHCKKMLAMYTRETKNKLGIASQYRDLAIRQRQSSWLFTPTITATVYVRFEWLDIMRLLFRSHSTSKIKKKLISTCRVDMHTNRNVKWTWQWVHPCETYTATHQGRLP